MARMGDHRKLRWLRHIASAARKQGKMTAHIESRLLPIFSVCLPTSVPQSLYSCPEMFPNVVLASRFQCLVIGLCLVHICAMCQSRPHTSSTVTVGMKEHTAWKTISRLFKCHTRSGTCSSAHSPLSKGTLRRRPHFKNGM